MKLVEKLMQLGIIFEKVPKRRIVRLALLRKIRPRACSAFGALVIVTTAGRTLSAASWNAFDNDSA